MKTTDIHCTGAVLHFIPVATRMPLKFGAQVLTSVVCARAQVTVATRDGRTAAGWGETPLSVPWGWPSPAPFDERLGAMKDFCVALGEKWSRFEAFGHAFEIGADFHEHALPCLLDEFNQRRHPGEPMPWLAALICNSLFDIAIHDAYGNVHGRPVYETYNGAFMNRTLPDFLHPEPEAAGAFDKKYPADFLRPSRANELPVWHLVGGLDPLDDSERTGKEPADGYPVTLTEWIERDSLKCLKIKLRGTDAEWDYARLVKVGRIARQNPVEVLSADFNCTVTDPQYVNEILDRLEREHPRVHEQILYVEQPFPYELEENQIDVRSVSQRKPLFLDESAHDWRMVSLGRSLGWTGVALKTCKTQTGALLSCCWARAHGMQIMVQDLTNPMLAQIPHVLLAAHVGTIMGVETNAMQFYPDASLPEAAVHPGIYRRTEGMARLDTIRGSGFGYRLEEMRRELPEAAARFEG